MSQEEFLDYFLDKKQASKFVCIICQLMPQPEDLCDHSKCGAMFCKKCIEKSLTTNKTCPKCRASMPKAVLTKENNNFVYNTLMELKVKCRSGKCKWTGELSSFDSHMTVCEFEEKLCKFSAAGCKKKGLLSELKLHYEVEKDSHIKMCEAAMINVQVNAEDKKSVEDKG